MCDEAGERQRLAGKHTYTMGQDKRDTSEWALLPRLRSLDGWKIPQHFYDRLDRAKHELGIPPGVSTEEFALDCMMVGLDLRLRLTYFRQLLFGTPRISDSCGTARGLYHYAGTSRSGSADEGGDAAAAGPSGVTMPGGRTPAAAKAW